MLCWECASSLANGVGRQIIEIVDDVCLFYVCSSCSVVLCHVHLCSIVSCLCLRVSLYVRPAGRSLRVVNKGSSCRPILPPSPWATQRLVTCGGARSITTSTDMLDVEKIPGRRIPDARLGERIAGASCWTPAVPAPNQNVNRTEWCCVRRECASSRCERVKSHIGGSFMYRGQLSGGR